MPALYRGTSRGARRIPCDAHTAGAPAPAGSGGAAGVRRIRSGDRSGAATGPGYTPGTPATVLPCSRRGDFGELSGAYQAVLGWCAAHGRRPAGPRWEIYGPNNENRAEQWTELYYLLT